MREEVGKTERLRERDRERERKRRNGILSERGSKKNRKT